LSQNDLEFYF